MKEGGYTMYSVPSIAGSRSLTAGRVAAQVPMRLVTTACPIAGATSNGCLHRAVQSVLRR
jgi:hypothetical protein